MRNIFISKESFVSDIAPKTDAICFTSNPFSEKSFVLYESGLVIGIDNATSQVDFECDMGMLLQEMITNEQHFFFISYMTEMERLLCVTREGLIMTLTENEEIEPVGDIEGGILACCWTNDQEVLLIVTSTGSLVLLNNSFELLNESHIDDLDNSEPVSISWRSDGEFVAINYKSNQKRCIKVFTKDLQFTSISHSMTEDIASGIHSPLSWNPDHSLIATVQEEKRKTLVSFYERNGLRHGEFVLPSNMRDIQIAYNSTGTIIAVTGTIDSIPVVQLWTRMNYHWYMKLQRQYETPILSVNWDMMNEMTLNVVFADGSINSLLLKWTVTNSNDFWNLNCVLDAYVLIWFSHSYAITPPPMYTFSAKWAELSSGVVAAFFESPSSTDSETPIPTLYILTNQSLVICKPAVQKETLIPTPRQFHRIFTSYQVVQSLPLPPGKFYSSGIHIDADRVALIYHEPQSSGLLFIHTTTGQMQEEDMSVCEIAKIDATSLLIEDCKNTLSILHVEEEDGSIETMITPLFTLSCYCEQLSVCHSPAFHTLCMSSSGRLFYDSQLLSNNIISCLIVFQYCAYIINDVIPKLCFIPLSQLDTFTSYVNPTTSIPLNPNFSRSLERGSFLVGYGFDGRMTVQLPRGNLETFYPRLLSCNHIEQLMYEAEPKWQEIVELMRRQRIPLDLLYDIDPAYFIQHVESFVKSQLKEDRINLFLSNLTDDDFTAEGQDYYQMFSAKEKPSGWNKRQMICSSFLPVLKDLQSIEATITCLCEFNPPRLEEALFYLQDIIQQENKPIQLKEREEEDSEEEEEEESNLGLKGMKWLLILVEPSIIYNVALGTYDLDLTELVAFLSQQDPREFKPYLAHLRALPIALRQYEIDKQIKRWSHVIRDVSLILQSDLQTDEHLSREELFEEATRIFNERDLVADYLRGFSATSYANAMHKQVGDYYVKKQDYVQALQHYLVVDPLPVQEVLSVTTLLGNSQVYLSVVYEYLETPEERARAIQKLCTHLRNGVKADIAKAATLYIEHLADEEEAVVCLCSIQQFIQAIAIAHKFDRADLIETVIHPKINEFYQGTVEGMKEKREKLDRVVARITAIHEEKQKKEEEREELINDNESVWSQSTRASAMTGITAVSGMTSFFQDSAEGNTSSLLNVTPVESIAELSKRADNTDIHAKRSVKVMKFGKEIQVEKKEKKKKMKIRAGSPQEEEALMKMVELLTAWTELKAEVTEMIECLLVIHRREEAVVLQKEFHTHLDAIVNARKTLKMEVDENELTAALAYSWLEY